MITGTVGNAHADEPDARLHQRVGVGQRPGDAWSTPKLVTATPSFVQDAQHPTYRIRVTSGKLQNFGVSVAPRCIEGVIVRTDLVVDRFDPLVGDSTR